MDRSEELRLARLAREAERQKAPEVRARISARRRERWATDPEYRERRKAEMRRSRRARPDAKRAYNAAYYAAHREAISAQRYPRVYRPSVDERFWSKVDPSGECWEWTGYINPKGYGQWHSPRPSHSNVYAHRYAYERLVGPIPDGLQIDHLCRNRSCVRPDHMEPVTPRENVLRGESEPAANARKTHCKNGHALIAGNIYSDHVARGRSRCCLACKQAKPHRKAGA